MFCVVDTSSILQPNVYYLSATYIYLPNPSYMLEKFGKKYMYRIQNVLLVEVLKN